MRKILLKIGCLFLAFISLTFISLTFISCGIGEGNKETKEVNLYESGIETALVMEEMAESENFKTLLGAPEYDFPNALAEDYKAPVSVYSISTPTYEQYFHLLETAKEGEAGPFTETWNSLSDALKDQINKRVSFSTITNLVLSSHVGVSELSVSSIYRAYLRFDGALEEEISYLYVYEVGAPIIVTFTPACCDVYSATGQFLLGLDCSSLDKVRELKKMIAEADTECIIEIDGGISAANAAEVFEAGVEVVVAGSAVFCAADPEGEIVKILNS